MFPTVPLSPFIDSCTMRAGCAAGSDVSSIRSERSTCVLLVSFMPRYCNHPFFHHSTKRWSLFALGATYPNLVRATRWCAWRSVVVDARGPTPRVLYTVRCSCRFFILERTILLNCDPSPLLDLCQRLISSQITTSLHLLIYWLNILILDDCTFYRQKTWS